ncbi:MAG: hypothetical protein GY769_18655 [bacterium]|nr:hypothetical protein [bacterium]
MLVTLTLVSTLVQIPPLGAPLMLREPAISSDASQIAFMANGDLYLGSVAGGEATRIVDDPVHALHPRFASSGDRIAFTSLRSGNGDVYLVDLDTLTQRRLTHHSSEDAVESWSPDGAFVYFSSSRADIGGYSDIYAVPVEGGTPFPVSRARFKGEYNASASPDGERLAFNSNDRVRQWYRMGPRTDDATEVWIKSTDPSSNRFERVTRFEGKDSWPMWSPDSDGVYVVTDEYSGSGAENLVLQDLTGTRRPITSFERGRVSWPTIANDGTIAFERQFGIWTVRDGSAPRRVDFALSEDEIDDEPTRAETISRVSEFHVNESAAVCAVVIHGDVFVHDLRTGDVARITDTPAPEQDVRVSPDVSRVAYVALRNGFFDVFVYDLHERRETRLTSTPETERHLRFSPNGERIAFVEGADRLKVVDTNGQRPVQMATDLMMAPELAWSPEGRLIAYVSSDSNWLSNVWLVQVDAPGRKVQLTDLPDVYSAGLSWLEDGRTLLLGTWTTRETRQVARIQIPDRLVDGVDDEWNDAVEDVEVEYLLPANESLVLEAVGRNGKTAVLSGASLGRSGLWRSAIEEGDLGSFTLIAPGRITSATVLGDDSVLYLSGGELHRLDVEGNESDRIELSFDFDVDPRKRRLALFREAWLVVRDWFGDESFNGKNWEALYSEYEPFVRGARNDFDFMTVIRMMVGELNASRTEVWGDPRVDGQAVGDLGVDFDGTALKGGRFVVSSSLFPATGEDSGLLAGEVIEAIEGTVLGRGVNLSELLTGAAGEMIAVTVERGGKRLEVRSRVRSTNQVSEQRYRKWIAWNEALVDELSGGRFAYVHRRHFGTGATEALRRQLGASALGKDGVVLDVRYNGGGIESTRAIGYLRRKIVHLNAFQDKVVAPGALVHGIPVLDRPVVLVQNEQVLSDTESLSHQFRALGVGPVVGTRTSGWNKGQRGYGLFDGTRISVGAWKALTSNGEDMERRGREPDIYVDRSIEETLVGRDSQLESAVEALDEWIRSRGLPGRQVQEGERRHE